jgi:hypothetical protein
LRAKVKRIRIKEVQREIAERR